MNDDITILKKLIEDTLNDKIVWHKKEDKFHFGFAPLYEEWTANSKITVHKKIQFVISHHINNHRLSEIKTFLVNDFSGTKEPVHLIDPNIFTWKINKEIKILIPILYRKRNEQLSRNFVGPVPPPPIPKGWEGIGWEEWDKKKVPLGNKEGDWEEVVY